MFAKALWPPDAVTLPLLIAEGIDVELLHQAGWDYFSDGVLEAEAEVCVTPDALTLTVESQALLTGPNPVSPPGWWESVDGLAKHVVVVALPKGTDLAAEGLLNVVEGLREDERTAQALVRVSA